jgi:hypothetical protein
MQDAEVHGVIENAAICSVIALELASFLTAALPWG